MTTKAEKILIEYKTLPKKERKKILSRLLKEEEGLLEEMWAQRLLEERKNDTERPFEEYLAEYEAEKLSAIFPKNKGTGGERHKGIAKECGT